PKPMRVATETGFFMEGPRTGKSGKSHQAIANGDSLRMAGQYRPFYRLPNRFLRAARYEGVIA
ncbi:hypothetical protein, partial [Pseudomonas syringae group genomosp. 7]|uniref:hypothetical protein n=1 Tax=Pseudomonas syringae group genomosp. 7 TaxID=251699 RepID=UPI00376FA44E